MSLLSSGSPAQTADAADSTAERLAVLSATASSRVLPGNGQVARMNPVRSAHRQYQQSQIETASPTRLIILLYDGAIRFCSLALESLQAHDLENQNTNLIKAQRILGELMGSLNREVGEVANNLFRLYMHMLEQLVEANLNDKPEPIQTVIGQLRDLRESWVEIDRLTSQVTSATAAPTNASPAALSLGEQRA